MQVNYLRGFIVYSHFIISIRKSPRLAVLARRGLELFWKNVRGSEVDLVAYRQLEHTVAVAFVRILLVVVDLCRTYVVAGVDDDIAELVGDAHGDGEVEGVAVVLGIHLVMLVECCRQTCCGDIVLRLCREQEAWLDACLYGEALEEIDVSEDRDVEVVELELALVLEGQVRRGYRSASFSSLLRIEDTCRNGKRLAYLIARFHSSSKANSAHTIHCGLEVAVELVSTLIGVVGDGRCVDTYLGSDRECPGGWLREGADGCQEGNDE